MPCWNILKGEDKWAAKMVELAELEKQEKKSNKKQKAATVSRPRDEEGTNNEQAVTYVVGQQTEARKKPDGIKKAKENLRRGGGEACLEALDKIWAKMEVLDNEKEKAKQERFMASLEIDKEAQELEKKRVQIDKKKADAEQKRAEAELLKEEKEIMLADMTTLNPMQLQWLETMQKQIVARRLAN
jgi:hypothetical protein